MRTLGGGPVLCVDLLRTDFCFSVESGEGIKVHLFVFGVVFFAVKLLNGSILCKWEVLHAGIDRRRIAM